jgi:hypothetical protein
MFSSAKRSSQLSVAYCMHHIDVPSRSVCNNKSTLMLKNRHISVNLIWEAATPQQLNPHTSVQCCADNGMLQPGQHQYKQVQLQHLQVVWCLATSQRLRLCSTAVGLPQIDSQCHHKLVPQRLVKCCCAHSQQLAAELPGCSGDRKSCAV